MTDKYLINCQHGGDDLEKATVAMIVASAASAMGGEGERTHAPLG
jgi:predicted peroxiredoxin